MVERKLPVPILLLFASCALQAATAPVDTIPRSLSLPAAYPESWLFVHDLNYFSMTNGRFIVLDLAADYGQHKGAFQGSQLANFVESRRRSELYVTETVYARGTRGERTDLLTIYEKVHLTPVAEVVLPGGKRALMVPRKASMQLTGDEKFLLVFNFTPAASITVVDTDRRQVTAEIPVPGCSLNYSSGQRGVFSLCANGTMVGFTLTDDGRAIEEYVSAPFNDLDDDVLAVHPATIDGTTYLVSFDGNIQPIDTSNNKAEVLPAWALLAPEQAAVPWQPADGQAIASDSAGRLFVLMNRNEAKQHDKASSEVWVFDTKQHKRLARFALREVGSAIEVTQGQHPRLAVLSEKGVDVYDTRGGKFIRTIGGWISWTPVLLHASKQH
jgi:methylamine dehydrogenase heavy chain